MLVVDSRPPSKKRTHALYRNDNNLMRCLPIFFCAVLLPSSIFLQSREKLFAFPPQQTHLLRQPRDTTAVRYTGFLVRSKGLHHVGSFETNRRDHAFFLLDRVGVSEKPSERNCSFLFCPIIIRLTSFVTSFPLLWLCARLFGLQLVTSGAVWIQHVNRSCGRGSCTPLA